MLIFALECLVHRSNFTRTPIIGDFDGHDEFRRGGSAISIQEALVKSDMACLKFAAKTP